MTTTPEAGTLVRYAEGLYRVVAVTGDLVRLAGVATVHRVCRAPCTVLASDVEIVQEAGG